MTEEIHTAKGFAAVKHGLIFVETVSPTERAAKVNYLVARCDVQILASFPDDQINKLFDSYSRGAEIRTVDITVR